MAFSFGFYNSFNGDRKYNSLQISQIFDGVIRDGIYATIGEKMVVKKSNYPNSVVVGPGRGWFNHTWNYNDADLLLEGEPSEILLNRIDAIVLDIQGGNDERTNDIIWVKGTPSQNPVHPEMIHTVDHHQYPLAYVYRQANVNVINQENITNTVGSSECPFVTGILENVSIDDLLLQWKDQWAQFVANYEDTATDWMDAQKELFLSWANQMKETIEEFTSDYEESATDWMSEQKATYITWFNSVQDTLQNLPDAAAFFGGINIPNGADLNNYVAPGIYKIQNNSNIENSPNKGLSGTLIVLESRQGNKRQIFVPLNPENGIQGRYMNISSFEWSEWIQSVNRIKGNQETEYRGGNVNLTPDDIGSPSLYPITGIPANSDLNNYTKIGTYCCASGSIASTVLNTPITNTGFRLAVYNIFGSVAPNNSTYITQIVDDRYGKTYIRTRNSSTEWAEWVKVLTNEAANTTYVKKNGDTMSKSLQFTGLNNFVRFYPVNVDGFYTSFGVGSGGNNRGWWDSILDNWVMVFSNSKELNVNPLIKLLNKTILNNIGEFRRSTGQGVYEGSPGKTGWVIFAEIKVTSLYGNYTLEMEVGGRGRKFGTILSLMFKSVTDISLQDLSSFQCYGGSRNIFRIKKVASDTWQIIAQKNESYGEIYVMRVNSQIEFKEKSLTITYPNTMLSGEPDSTWIAPTLGGEIETADKIDGYHVTVVNALPSDAASHTDTLYFVKQ